MRSRVVGILAMAVMAIGLWAAPASAVGCHDNGTEMAAIAQFGQAGLTAGEVWGGMASSQHSEFSDVEDGPGVVARHMQLQMEAYCGG